MKLIIDISEGIYKHVDAIQNGSIGAKQIINSVKNGIPAYKDIPSANMFSDLKAEISMYENNEQSIDEMIQGIKSIISIYER